MAFDYIKTAVKQFKWFGTVVREGVNQFECQWIALRYIVKVFVQQQKTVKKPQVPI